MDCHCHTVEQAVVYSTLPQEYSTLTFWGEVVADGGGEEKRSKVMYWHRGAYIILQRHNMSQLYSVTDGGLGPRIYDYISIWNTTRMTKIGVSGTSGR